MRDHASLSVCPVLCSSAFSGCVASEDHNYSGSPPTAPALLKECTSLSRDDVANTGCFSGTPGHDSFFAHRFYLHTDDSSQTLNINMSFFYGRDRASAVTAWPLTIP